MNDYISPQPQPMEKKPKPYYFVRLESESSLASEGTESVDSIQDRETEYVQDTEDSNSDNYFEYEVASVTETEKASSDSSSGTDDIYVTEEVIAAVLGDTSLEAWAPDGGEDSYSSATDFEDFGKTDFWTCAQCKSENKNPRFRLCEKCFQVRKTFYPPRPKRCKKRKTESNKEGVSVDNLRSCLSGLSQDSGVGSSQELSSLDFKDIKVAEKRLSKCGSSSSGVSTDNGSSSSSGSIITTARTKDSECIGTTNRKRKFSDNSSDNDVRPKKIIIEGPLNSKNEIKESLNDRIGVKAALNEELCIICASNKKNGIFLHGNSAHSCCCYTCAIKTWKTTKKCPVCNRRVSNVVKLYTI